MWAPALFISGTRGRTARIVLCELIYCDQEAKQATRCLCLYCDMIFLGRICLVLNAERRCLYYYYMMDGGRKLGGGKQRATVELLWRDNDGE